MRWLYSLDLGNGLDCIGIGSVYQCDTLTVGYTSSVNVVVFITQKETALDLELLVPVIA